MGVCGWALGLHISWAGQSRAGLTKAHPVAFPAPGKYKPQRMVRGDGRVTYSRRHAYHTKSNKMKVVKTPGGKLVAHFHKKSAKGPRCGDCGISLPGIKHLRPKQYKNLKKREKTISRAYGGSRCAGCVRQRVVRAFLIEEQKIVKKVLLEKQKKKKA